MNDTLTLLSFLLGQNYTLVKKKVRTNCHSVKVRKNGI